MNIIHVITTIELGGAENQLLLLAREQVSLGNNVKIIPLKGIPVLLKDFENAGVKVDISLINQNYFSQARRLRKIIVHEKANESIIHSHLPRAELIVRICSPKKYTTVNTRHYGGGFYPRKNPIISSFLGRVASKKADCVIGISDSVVKLLLKENEVYNRKKVRRIYYGFSGSRFANEETKVVNAKSNSSLLIGTIARLSPEKDLVTLLKAFEVLVKTNLNALLYIIGDGPDKIYLSGMARELGIESKVIWEGKKRNILRYLKSFDVFVLTSKFEGFGMVLLEAMFAGTKIVCAKNSAIEEVIGESKAGIYFQTSNSDDLFKKIQQAISLGNDATLDMQSEQRKRLEIFKIQNCAREHQLLYSALQKKTIS